MKRAWPVLASLEASNPVEAIELGTEGGLALQ